jgi:penicillin-binding protein 1A
LPVNPAPRVISEQNVWIMDDILSDVIRRGTGRRALALGRSDIGGKTGTTNESKDAWFNGFNQDLVATVWVGYDEATPLGEGEEGSRTAVPIWTAFMQEALKGVPQRSRPMPAGIIQVAISMDTGALTTADDPFAITEYFMADRPPGGDGIAVAEGGAPVLPADTTPTDPLF